MKPNFSTRYVQHKGKITLEERTYPISILAFHEDKCVLINSYRMDYCLNSQHNILDDELLHMFIPRKDQGIILEILGREIILAAENFTITNFNNVCST